ncbi:MAG: SprT family zinc-dependent metalloprotease [Candidatus Saccharimonadales bacterium]
MPIIEDAEFGNITVRRSAKASHVRIRVAPNGTLRASLPLYAPLFVVKRLIKNSRKELQQMLLEHHGETHYEAGMQIGKSHSLIVRNDATSLSVKRHGQQIVLTLPTENTLNDNEVASVLRPVIISALRLEAKSYLPKRLSYLAKNGNFSYDSVRFSHASGRWGSCSSNGTISLNIALMKLPFELIDYVLVHELSHTVHMNHSEEFWELVSSGDPAYRIHRRDLKKETPSI